MARFGTFEFGEELFGTGSSTPSGPGGWNDTGMVRVPWVFRDISEDDEYEFAVNPLDANIPGVQRTYTNQPTAAGNQVIFQGRDKVAQMSFSGTILTEAHLNALKFWFTKQKQVQITDDLGRKWWIYLKNINFTRQNTIGYPWRHEYSCEAVVVDWGEI